MMKWSNKKALVTGAAGFIGQSLVKSLLSQGAYVIAFDNLSYGKKENIPKSINEIIIGDVLSRKDLDKVKETDYVFHLAGPSSVILFNEDPAGCFHTTVCGFLNILEWANQKCVKKVIYPSSGSVYGNTTLPQSEETQCKPTNLYGIAKLSCEALAKRCSEHVPTVGLRIFAGYGPGEDHKGDFASVINLFSKSIMIGEAPVIYGDGTQERDFIYIDDIISSIIISAEKDISNVVINIGSGKAYSFNAVASIINTLLGTNVQPKYVRRPNGYLENTCADVKKMKRLLNINPIPLEEGLSSYLGNWVDSP